MKHANSVTQFKRNINILVFAQEPKSAREIATHIKIARHTVEVYVKRLEEAGYLSKEKLKDGRGKSAYFYKSLIHIEWRI